MSCNITICSIWNECDTILGDNLKPICAARYTDVPSATEQGAVADLPAADISIVKYKTALSVFDQFIFDYNGQSAPFIAFRDYCQQQLTVLAGR